MTTMADIRIHNVGPLDQIPPGEGRTFHLGDEEVAVFRTRPGEVFATQARCPHRGAPLADGLMGSGRIVCPLHAYTFDLRTGEPVRNGCPALRTYEVAVSPSGEVLVRSAARGGVCA